MSYKIKYNYKGVFRRTTLESLDVQTVRRGARQLYAIPGTQKIHLTWVDEDGDSVHISTQEEFEEFMQYHAVTGSGAAAASLPPQSFKVGVITEPRAGERKRSHSPRRGRSKSPRTNHPKPPARKGVHSPEGGTHRHRMHSHSPRGARHAHRRSRSKSPPRKGSHSPPRGPHHHRKHSHSPKPDSAHSEKRCAAAKAKPSAIGASSPVHWKTACGVCAMSPIIGTRYKCVGRVDYSLCSACEEKASEHPFPMVKMVQPNVGNRLRLKGKGFGPSINKNRAPGSLPTPTPLTGPPQHDGITCNECGVGPIIGLRFKCTGRDAYDLCAACEGAKQQPFPMIKIYRPDPLVHVKGWGSDGKICPANPFGFKGFPAPVGKRGGSSASPEWRRRAMKPTAKFVEDVTIPDATSMAPSTEFVKTWLIRNEGPGDWQGCGSGVRLVAAGGDLMCAADISLPVAALKAGEEGLVSVPLLSPMNCGRYVAYFRLLAADGIVFGQKLWVDIRVVSTAVDVAPASEVILVRDAEMDDGDADTKEPLEAAFVEEDFVVVNPTIITSSSVDATAAISSSSDVAAKDVELEAAELEWKVELNALNGMGFSDTGRNVELLKKHTKLPFSQHPQLHGKPFSESLTTILDALLK